MSVLPSRAVLPDGGFSAGRVQGQAGAEIAAAARALRIGLLASALIAMSVLDLYITLLYLGSIGLAEENPVARAVMSNGSPGLLAVWKILTLLPTLFVLIRYRRRVAAEVLAWVACLILVGVTVRWKQYADQTDLLLISLPALEDGIDHRWVPPLD